MPEEPPPLVDVTARPAAAGRVALGLFLFGLLDLGQDVYALSSALKAIKSGEGFHLNLPVTFLGIWAAALLVWLDKRVIWPILAYLSAAGLGSLVGGALVAGLGVPFKLVRAYATSEPAWFGFYAAYLVLTALFMIWVLMEARRVAWPAGSAMPPTPWLKPGAFIGYGALLSGALFAGLLLLLNGSWTRPAVERARQRLGEGYDYQVLSYNFRSVNGHTTYHAVVLAYTDTQLESIQLNWED